MTVLDKSPAVHVPAFAFDAFDVQFPGPEAAPVPSFPEGARPASAGPGDLAEQSTQRSRFADRRMQRAREQLPPVEQVRRLSIALCDRPYCLSPDEMTTLSDVFLYNDAHGS